MRSVMVWLALATPAAFALVYLVGSLAVGAAVRRLERQNVEQRVARARGLLRRQAEIDAAIIREYAWWTDTWDYIDRPGTPAAARFIRDNFVDWLPRQYDDRLIAIWSLDRRRVLVWADSAAQGLELLFERPRRFDFAARVKAAGGLLAAPSGLFLASTSVVVRTDDQRAEGPWHGYMALAHPVSDSVLDEWGAALQERFAIRPASPEEEGRVGGSVVSSVTAGGDSVESRFLVPDLFGESSVLVSITGSRAAAAALRSRLLVAVGTAGFFSLVLVALLILVIRRSVVRPLEEMVLALGRMREGGQLTALGAPAKAREWAVFAGAFNETVEALQASETRYRTLFEQSADALFVLEGPEQRIVDANPAARRLAGCAGPELVGRSLLELLEPPPAGAAGLPGTRRLARGAGPAATVEVVTGNIQFGSRRLQLASLRDVSERQALEERLRQAQKMEVLGRLAGGIAHDFNNLLGAVLVSASGLRREVGGDEQAQVSVSTIERAARRAADLTRQLLSFARREGVRREPVSIDDVVSSVRDLCVRTFAHGVEVAVELGAKGATVLGDAGQLEQALLNLCLNARDATPRGGTVRIESRIEEVDEAAARQTPGLAPGSHVVLSVADSGAGIDSAAGEHLFEPFFTTKERGKGTGLGLAVTYGIVRGHGGVIKVHSEVGRGSRFEIYLRRADAAAVAPARPSSGALPTGSETILVVDDEEELRKTVAHALTRLGYKVVEAANGRDALARLAERPGEIQLVMLDLLMPEMGGVEAYRAMRRLGPEARVLVFTGYASEAEIGKLLEDGVEGVLYKPFEISELAATVRRVLDRATPPPGA